MDNLDIGLHQSPVSIQGNIQVAEMGNLDVFGTILLPVTMNKVKLFRVVCPNLNPSLSMKVTTLLPTFTVWLLQMALSPSIYPQTELGPLFLKHCLPPYGSVCSSKIYLYIFLHS